MCLAFASAKHHDWAYGKSNGHIAKSGGLLILQARFPTDTLNIPDSFDPPVDLSVSHQRFRVSRFIWLSTIISGTLRVNAGRYLLHKVKGSRSKNCRNPFLHFCIPLPPFSVSCTPIYLGYRHHLTQARGYYALPQVIKAALNGRR